MGQGLWCRRAGIPPRAHSEGPSVALADRASHMLRPPTFKNGVSRNTLGPDYQVPRRFLFSINKHSWSTKPVPAAISDASPQIQLPSARPSPRASPPSRTWGLGLMLGLGASQPWAWDTAPRPAGLTAHPSDYIWALSGPCGPRPRPCCFPGTRADTGRGPGAPSPSMAMCPPGCQGPGPRGWGKIPSERPRASLSFPWDQRPTPQRKVCLHPPWRRRSSLPLKGHEPLTGPGPLPGRGHLHRAPRPGLLTFGVSAVTHRPGWGSEGVSYPPKVTKP